MPRCIVIRPDLKSRPQPLPRFRPRHPCRFRAGQDVLDAAEVRLALQVEHGVVTRLPQNHFPCQAASQLIQAANTGVQVCQVHQLHFSKSRAREVY